MCGIFAYHGTAEKADSASQILKGLQRLEYRGYDSWGIAAATGTEVPVYKKVGKISGIDRSKVLLPPTKIAIGHTRWATHGGVTEINAHPHRASDDSFVLAQNGVVENFDQLKGELLEQGHDFISETDTEVIVRLIEQVKKKTDNLVDAVRQAHQRLAGRNTIIVLTPQGEIIAARQGSPLLLGFGHQPGELYISSDVLSFADEVSQIVTIENGQLVQISPDGNVQLIDLASGALVPIKPEPLDLKQPRIDKEGYPHFMVKEIHETPMVIRKVVAQTSSPVLRDAVSLIRKAGEVYIIGSGTAGIAAAQIAYYLREIAGLRAVGLVGADASEYVSVFKPGDVLIAPSQSGETADVLEVLEKVKAMGVKIITYVNMPASSMTRLADVSCMAEAGPEICVMSTKVFVSQIAWGFLLAHAVAGSVEKGSNELEAVAEQVQDYLEDSSSQAEIETLADQLLPHRDVFLLAKGQLYQIMREGMVKVIEGSYKHAHAIPAGDLKHYAITLMEKGVVVLVAVAEDGVKQEVLNAAHEVKARGATVIGISAQTEPSFDVWLKVPNVVATSAMSMVVTLQLLAYHLAAKLGHDVDHPRNIAKSVTVK